MANNKTYILIDYDNQLWAFVNGQSDIGAFYAANNINISNLNRDANNILLDVVLVNLKTKAESSIKYTTGKALCPTNTL
jgi:hypothetical protein